MTNAGATLGGTDWWLMDADGAHKRRLTSMNIPGHPQCDGHARWAGLASWAADGSALPRRWAVRPALAGRLHQDVRVLPDGTGSGLKGEYFTQKDLTSGAAHPGATGHPRRSARRFRLGLGLSRRRDPDRWLLGALDRRGRAALRTTPILLGGLRRRRPPVVGDTLVIDGWSGHAALESSGTIALTTGRRYPIRLEYFDDTWSASVRLSWASAHQVKQVIPATQLYPVSARPAASARAARTASSPQATAEGPAPRRAAVSAAGRLRARLVRDPFQARA